MQMRVLVRVRARGRVCARDRAFVRIGMPVIGHECACVCVPVCDVRAQGCVSILLCR